MCQWLSQLLVKNVHRVHEASPRLLLRLFPLLRTLAFSLLSCPILSSPCLVSPPLISSFLSSLILFPHYILSSYSFRSPLFPFPLLNSLLLLSAFLSSRLVSSPLFSFPPLLSMLRSKRPGLTHMFRVARDLILVCRPITRGRLKWQRKGPHLLLRHTFSLFYTAKNNITDLPPTVPLLILNGRITATSHAQGVYSRHKKLQSIALHSTSDQVSSV